MLNQISQLPPGSAARVRIAREGKDVELSVTVGERPLPQRAP
jgi:S1-C subfamily serine protease